MHWPLWCDTGDTCPLSCFQALKFWPFVLIHVALFYGSASVILLTKTLGLWPEQFAERASKHYDTKFDNAFYVAWHIPMAVMAVPLGMMSLQGAYQVWSTGDPRQMYGDITNPIVNEVGTWFTCFLFVDAMLVAVHGLGDKELYIHHAIFGCLNAILLGNCACPFTGAMLVAQELSTPALNMFTLLRAFKGIDNTLTQASFLLFTLLFYIFRVFINCYVTWMFVREVATGLLVPTNFVISLPLQLLVMVAVVGGAVLQLHWASVIAKKINSALAGPAQKDD